MGRKLCSAVNWVVIISLQFDKNVICIALPALDEQPEMKVANLSSHYDSHEVPVVQNICRIHNRHAIQNIWRIDNLTTSF